jgi:NADH:ubiquinone oxidoreductase subunit 5 (subunit L)/multisubunit Na+/H+ antiporter MnhA subunit
MTLPILLAVFAIPSISIPFVYLAGKKSPKLAAMFVALIALINIGLVLSTFPTVLNDATHRYVESYSWIPSLNGTQFSLFLDGISASVALISLVLIFVAAVYSVNYMAGKKTCPLTMRCSVCLASV